MKPQFQKDGDRQCVRVAIASLFGVDVEDVPFFGGALKFDEAARADGRATKLLEDELVAWLAQRGLGRAYMTQVMDLPTGARGLCLAAGPTERGTYHVVVWDTTPGPGEPSGRMVHDPHPSGTGLAVVSEWMMFVVLDPTLFGGRA